MELLPTEVFNTPNPHFHDEVYEFNTMDVILSPEEYESRLDTEALEVIREALVELDYDIDNPEGCISENDHGISENDEGIAHNNDHEIDDQYHVIDQPRWRRTVATHSDLAVLLGEVLLDSYLK